MNYLGLDIGGTAVKIGLIDPQGTVLCKDAFPAAFDGYKTPLMQTALQSMERFLKQHAIAPDALGGIGVSATGQIDSRTGVVVGSAGHIDNWLGTPVKELLQKQYGLPVSVINDANSVALAEQWVGAAAGFSHVIVITVGTGVGGGVITDGRLLTGCGGLAGELGHFPIQADGHACSCGNPGCYERYASTTALVRMVRENYAALQLPFPADQVDGKAIFALAADGHAGICRLLDAWIGYVAAGLIGLTHIFNPERILVGGGVCRQKTLFIEPLRRKVLKGVMPRFGESLVLKAAALGNDAGMIGAVRGLI
ncbi:MAG: ROK family protein [Lachnospiraceae bacterium]|nr:ROK family protein [Lachnospiraceae bacterium]